MSSFSEKRTHQHAVFLISVKKNGPGCSSFCCLQEVSCCWGEQEGRGEGGEEEPLVSISFNERSFYHWALNLEVNLGKQFYQSFQFSFFLSSFQNLLQDWCGRWFHLYLVRKRKDMRLTLLFCIWKSHDLSKMSLRVLLQISQVSSSWVPYLGHKRKTLKCLSEVH